MSCAYSSANCLMGLKLYLLAAQQFRRALKTRKKFIRIKVMSKLAMCYESAESLILAERVAYKASCEAYAMMNTFNPDAFNAHISYVKILLRLGKRDLARDELVRAVNTSRLPQDNKAMKSARELGAAEFPNFAEALAEGVANAIKRAMSRPADAASSATKRAGYGEDSRAAKRRATTGRIECQTQ